MRHVVLLFALLAALLVSRCTAIAATPAVKLNVVAESSVVDANDYAFMTGDVRFVAEITNGGDTPIAISGEAGYEICPESLARDGEKIEPTLSHVDYIDGPPLKRDTLVDLAPGKSLGIQIRGLRCLRGEGYEIRGFRSSPPGRYEVRFVYRYERDAYGHKGVLREAVLSNTVRFDLVTPVPPPGLELSLAPTARAFRNGPSFRSGPVELRATLTNRGPSSLVVPGDWVQGVCPAALFRDGVPVMGSAEMRQAPAQSPSPAARTLRPGKATTAVFRDIACVHAQTVRTFGAALAGHYRVPFVYRNAPTQGTIRASVEFDVVP